MGSVPDWYDVVKAARLVNVHPCVLAGVPETADCYAWVNWILDANSAEMIARENQAKQR